MTQESASWSVADGPALNSNLRPNNLLCVSFPGAPPCAIISRGPEQRGCLTAPAPGWAICQDVAILPGGGPSVSFYTWHGLLP